MGKKGREGQAHSPNRPIPTSLRDGRGRRQDHGPASDTGKEQPVHHVSPPSLGRVPQEGPDEGNEPEKDKDPKVHVRPFGPGQKANRDLFGNMDLTHALFLSWRGPRPLLHPEAEAKPPPEAPAGNSLRSTDRNG